MKSEKSHHTKNKREFGGCVELIPAQPDYIEFIDSRRIWGFAIHRLTHFVLQENPNCFGQKTLPPDLLFLIYPPAIVVLKGWRLEQLVGPLVNASTPRNISARSSSRKRGFPKFTLFNPTKPFSNQTSWRLGSRSKHESRRTSGN
jgi:hypothetical protein